MRTFRLLLFLTITAAFAQAQDPGIMAAQQAALNSQLATQQANQQMQLAQQAAQNAQMASTLATQQANYGVFVSRPKFSVKTGSYNSAITVKIGDTTRDAVIYYTTDGWTPTAASTRYIGPITISSSTQLQAVAIIPQIAFARSRIASAVYSLPAVNPAPLAITPNISSPPNSASAAAGKLLIPRGMAVPLVFASAVTSRTADIGDTLPLTLADDLKVADRVIAKKGTSVLATVTQANKAGSLGRPGVITFQVNGLKVDDTVVKLTGSATREGHDKAGTAAALFLIPPGVGALLEHGQDAEIAPGTTFVASVDADTSLSSLK